MTFRRLAARLVLAALILFHPLHRLSAQTPTKPPSPADAQAMLQNRPDLVGKLQAQLAASGLTPDQIKERLRAQGYPDSLLDAYMPGGKADSTAVPSADVFAAMRLLGLSDTTTTDSLSRVATRRRNFKSKLDSAFMDSLTLAAQNDTIADAMRRVLRSRGRAQIADSGFTVFGLNFFHNQTTQFDANTAGPVDDNYRFGLGDQLVLILTGDVETSYPLTVTREGFVVIPNVGQVPVANLTKAQLEDELYTRLGRVYSGIRRGPDARTHFSINVSKVGTNRVIVTGEVTEPNAYQVSRAGSVMDALYKAGGPTETGSLRNVIVRRGTATVGTLDVYDYLVHGDASHDVRLESGDVVFVPPHGPRARVVGAVLRPATYELKAGETISDLVQMAGGFTATADPARVQIERILPPNERPSLGSSRRVIEVPPQALGRNPAAETWIEDGDVVRVGEIPKRVAARVKVEGNVWSPGDVGFVPGMRLSDALHRAGGLKPDSYLGTVQISRLRPDSTYEMLTAQLRDTTGAVVNDITLADGDQIRTFSTPEFRSKRYINISGAVRKPGRYQYRENMTMRDAVLLAGGLEEGALLTQAEVARMPENRAGGVTAKTTRVPLDSSYLFDRTADGRYVAPPGIPAPVARAPEVQLQPYDDILILRQPDWALQRTVSISGEVKYPGRYTLQKKTETLRELIERAGGLTKDAYANGVSFYRQRDSVGRIGLDLGLVMRDANAPDNLQLADGDSIIVPVFTGVVQMSGQVNSPVAVAYVPGADLDYYIRAAGGGTAKSDVGRAYVRQPNGKVESRNRHFLIYHSTPQPEPGSTVVVPLSAGDHSFDYAGFFTGLASVLSAGIGLAAILRR